MALPRLLSLVCCVAVALLNTPVSATEMTMGKMKVTASGSTVIIAHNKKKTVLDFSKVRRASVVLALFSQTRVEWNVGGDLDEKYVNISFKGNKYQIVARSV